MTDTQTQFGKFELIKKLGAGGMGEVFLARTVDDPENKPPFVIKRILPHVAKDPDFVKLFFREAKVVSGLDHPHIIRVTDFGKEDRSFYMTLDFIDGVNLEVVLDQMVSNSFKLPIECGVEAIRQALSGINYAHEKKNGADTPLGLVHMDLSPKNLMIDQSGHLRILDFGIARASYEEDQKAYNNLCGTYAYMSPEQSREEAVDCRSDLFTLGIVLYELTTGQPLFGKLDSDFMMINAITKGMVPPPSNTIKNYPAELERIVYKALAVDRDSRYQSAVDFLADLDKVVETYHYNADKASLAKALAPLLKMDIKPTAKKKPEKRIVKPVKHPVKKQANKIPQPVIEKDPDPPSDMEPRGVAIEHMELELQVKQNRSRVMALFIIFLVVAIGVIGTLYVSKTGQLEETAGSPIYMPKSGSIHVRTIPDGATIFINMKEKDIKSPATFKQLPFGKNLLVEVVLPGYTKARKSITLSQDEPMDAILVELRKN